MQTNNYDVIHSRLLMFSLYFIKKKMFSLYKTGLILHKCINWFLSDGFLVFW